MLAPVVCPGDSAEMPTPAEQHYTPGEVAELWHFNVETIRQLFQNELGVLLFKSPIKTVKRPYKTIRIPTSVRLEVE